MVKILLLAANPLDTPIIRLDEESREIDSALRQSEFRDQFELNQHFAVRARDLQDLLLRHQPAIVHFSGHGTGERGILVEDDAGRSHPLAAEALQALFEALHDTVHCVVLSNCYGEVQAQAIAEHIDCVVGMADAISDKAAIQFSAAFYQALGYGCTILTAFKLGCARLQLLNLDQEDIPRLLTRTTGSSLRSFVAESAGRDERLDLLYALQRSLHEQLGILTRELHVLVAQAGRFGPSAPLRILENKQEHQDKINAIHSQLNELDLAIAQLAETRPPAAEPYAYLFVEHQGVLISRFPLVKDRTTIGRFGCDVPITEQFPAVSNQHTALIRRGNEILIEDFSSRGTYIDGNRVDKLAPLQPGQHVTLGAGSPGAGVCTVRVSLQPLYIETKA